MRIFKTLKDGWSDRHRGPVEPLPSVHSAGSLGGLTVIEVGLIGSFCSLGGLAVIKVSLTAGLYLMLDRLINGHKWVLLVRSMTPVRGHAYKRLRESPE
jgi:hypothetical protein